MKKVGIIGGIGPASTMDYYSGIIRGVRELTKSEEYPRLIIDSVNMTEMIGYVAGSQWDKLIALLLASIDHLVAAGANFAAIASNTPHLVFDEVQAKSKLPLISIVEETCRYAKRIGCGRAAVLGTLFTMRSRLYSEAFERYGIRAFVPEDRVQKEVYGIIFPNLENGIVLAEDKGRLLDISRNLISAVNADALVLGCTELPLAIKPSDLEITLLDTARIHIEAIVKEILA